MEKGEDRTTDRKTCKQSEKKSTRYPGIDQCEECGAMVRTRKDQTYAKHLTLKLS